MSTHFLGLLVSIWKPARLLAPAPLPLTVILSLAGGGVVISVQVRVVSTIIHVITHKVEVDAGPVGALELVEHAGPGPGGADSHVVLVPGVAAVADASTHLVGVDALPISALEPGPGRADLLAAVIVAQFRLLIAAVTTVIHLVAEIIQTHTEMIVTLVFVLKTVFSVRIHDVDSSDVRFICSRWTEEIGSTPHEAI